MIDGIDNNEYSFNTVIIAPSVEQVREFKVLSGVFSAEFGRGAGVVSVATKSGTNTLHGTVFEYLRNDAFDARNFFVRKVPLASGGLQKDPKPPLDRHQFGGAVGGALVLPGIYDGHSRTFFFADYAGLKEKRGQVFVNTVPTAQTRIGDFSDFRDTSGNLITIYDPLTTRLNPNFDSSRPVSATNPQFLRDPFPNNIIPANRINGVGRNVASIYPLPNGPGNFNNYTSTVNRDVTDNVFSGRVDHRVSDKDSFFVRFNWGKFKLDAPQGQAACCLPTPAEAAAKFDLGPFVAGIQNTRLTTHVMRDFVETLLDGRAGIVLVAVDHACLQRRIDLSKRHRRRARTHQLDCLHVDRRLNCPNLQPRELCRFADVARACNHLAKTERIAPRERPRSHGPFEVICRVAPDLTIDHPVDVIPVAPEKRKVEHLQSWRDAAPYGGSRDHDSKAGIRDSWRI